MLRYLKYFFWILYFANSSVRAEEEKKTLSIGEFAREVTTPVEIVGNLVTTGCMILGVICFFWGIVQYLEYRRNPHTVTLSSVLTLILPSIAFLSLSYIPNFLGVEVNPLQK